MQGYWKQPQETADAIRNGWLLTGDIGHVDTDGYFYITDRKKDMLLVNGINVYPREIEEVLYKFPGVKKPRSSACRTRAKASNPSPSSPRTTASNSTPQKYLLTCGND